MAKEDKSARFRRLATQRVNSAIKRIALVANLGNGIVYDYTPEQAEKVVSSLQKAVDDVQSAFRKATRGSSEVSF